MSTFMDGEPHLERSLTQVEETVSMDIDNAVEVLCLQKFDWSSSKISATNFPGAKASQKRWMRLQDELKQIESDPPASKSPEKSLTHVYCINCVH